jgi:hypothetical protein
MDAQPARAPSTGARQHCAGNARPLAAPHRYLAAGSTTGSCLVESADDGTALAKDHPTRPRTRVPPTAIGLSARATVRECTPTRRAGGSNWCLTPVRLTEPAFRKAPSQRTARKMRAAWSLRVSQSVRP